MSIDERIQTDASAYIDQPMPSLTQEGGGSRRWGGIKEITIIGALLVGAYLTFHATYEVITDLRIYHVQNNRGKAAAIEYARGLWKEIHPLEETFTGNVLNPGKKSAVLEYLGYQKLDEMTNE